MYEFRLSKARRCFPGAATFYCRFFSSAIRLASVEVVIVVCEKLYYRKKKSFGTPQYGPELTAAEM